MNNRLTILLIDSMDFSVLSEKNTAAKVYYLQQWTIGTLSLDLYLGICLECRLLTLQFIVCETVRLCCGLVSLRASCRILEPPPASCENWNVMKLMVELTKGAPQCFT